MNMYARIAMVTIALFLSACAPMTTSMVMRPGPSPVVVSGLNIIYLDAKTVLWDVPGRGAKSEKLARPGLTSAGLRDALLVKLPALLGQAGIAASARSVDPSSNNNPIATGDLFPKEALANHLLLVVPYESGAGCKPSHCGRPHTVSLSLRAPGDRRQIALVHVVQDPLESVQTYDGLILEIARVVKAMVSGKTIM